MTDYTTPTLRDTNIAKLTAQPFDVLVIGGGINGAVSAAASRRAARASPSSTAATSRGRRASSRPTWRGAASSTWSRSSSGWSASSATSRNHLIRSYPSTVQEIRFYTVARARFPPRPVEARPRHLALLADRQLLHPAAAPPDPLGRSSARSRSSTSRAATGGFEYSDAYLHDNDARFVWGFIRAALNYGCVAANYVESLGAPRRGRRLVTSRPRRRRRARASRSEPACSSTPCGPSSTASTRNRRRKTAHRHVSRRASTSSSTGSHRTGAS